MHFYIIEKVKGQSDWSKIPVLEFTLEPGKEIRANCYKCGDLTPKPHYLSWNPSTSANPDFHRPQDFGSMTLQ